MHEEGINISNKKTKSAFDFFDEGRSFDYVVTVCDEASASQCPIFPGVHKKINWSFADPSALKGSDEEKLIAIRELRDTIKQAIMQLIAQL